MTILEASARETTQRGELRFVEATALAQLRGTAAAASQLFAEMPFLSAALRGQLGEFIEAAIEEELVRQGSRRQPAEPGADLATTVARQLARARSLDLRGIVVVIGALDEVAGPGGVLDPDDSSALRGWAAAARRWPVTLLLDRRNLALAGHAAPVRLDDLLGIREPGGRAPAARALVPEVRMEVPHEASPADEPPDEPPASEVPDPIDGQRFAEELHAARGPKPLGVVEKLFLTRYVPLAEAEMHGHLDAFGRQVRAEWAANFSRSYSEAFQALRVTGKRPAMVFDVPAMAARIARLHGARSVELLLVDGMRYDLGQRVQRRLGRMLGARAACAESLLLWSALPSTTATQLDLLAHGLEALNRPLAGEEPEIARGRNVAVPRRVKIGQRDVVKNDAVEARMREAGGPLPERLEAVAAEVAQGVVRHAATLPERTLLVVFGDHGFTVEASATGSGPAHQGGSSPEEVLVPGYAWLLGNMH
ncbi:MAG: hypothetical protein EOO75_13280 [Myxococcales bacterium]|nr:MAG: hypothetical protein EOO75_13280 [Myxococcales bacterium]